MKNVKFGVWNGYLSFEKGFLKGMKRPIGNTTRTFHTKRFFFSSNNCFSFIFLMQTQ